MTQLRLNLLQEFPEHKHTILHLVVTSNHFARLYDEYHKAQEHSYFLNSAQSKIDILDLKDQIHNLIISARLIDAFERIPV